MVNDSPSYETPKNDNGAEVEVELTSSSKAGIRDREARRALFLSPTGGKPQPPLKAGSPTTTERCILSSRHSHGRELDNMITVYVDLPTMEEVESIPLEVLHSLSKKAFLLLVYYRVLIERGDNAAKFFDGTAQAGIVLDDDGQNALMVTARHNISRDSKKRIVKATCILKFGPDQDKQKVDKLVLKWPQRNCDCSAWRLILQGCFAWSRGWDIDALPVRLENHNGGNNKPKWKFWKKRTIDFFDESMVFQKVNAEYEYTRGDRIAIVVSSFGLTETATPENCTIVDWKENDPPSQEKLRDIFGDTGGFSIYVGEITEVGRNHIGHNINTYPGCSGAIIFRWDIDTWKEHPEGPVTPEAIAVHVGYHDGLQKNIGLKLCNGTKLGLLEHIRQRFRSWRLPSPLPSSGALKTNTAAPSIGGPSQTDLETIPGIDTGNNETVSKESFGP